MPKQVKPNYLDDAKEKTLVLNAYPQNLSDVDPQGVNVPCNKLRNPKKIAHLRLLSGQAEDVKNLLMNCKQTEEKLDLHYSNTIWSFSKNDTYKLTYNFCCPDGKRQSVAFAELLAARVRETIPDLNIVTNYPALDGYPPLLAQKRKTKKIPKNVATMPVCLDCGLPLCEICKTCETPGCKFFGFGIDTYEKLLLNKPNLARTQKVRGIATLKNESETFMVPVPFIVIGERNEIPGAVSKFTYYTSIFARPCPVRPRHGFVESRVIEYTDKLETCYKLWDEMREVDPESELILMPKIDAKSSIVVTPGRLAVGPGHDGATSGNKSVSIPLVGAMPPELTTTLLKNAGINLKTEDPYIEAVAKPDGTIYVTQLRAGPKIPNAIGQDYVPEKIKVIRLLKLREIS